MKRKNMISFIYLLLCGILVGCEYDDRYHYVHSYRIANQLKESVSGYIILDPIYYNDSIYFQIATDETVDLLNKDGGDGPGIKPIERDDKPMKEMHLNLKNTVLNINLESNDLCLGV